MANSEETEMESKTETKELLEKDKDDKRSNLKKASGIIAMFLDVILFSASATSVQLLERRIPDLELNSFRLGIPLLFYTIGLLILRKWPIIKRSEIGTAFLFSLFSLGSEMFTFVAVTFLPAATVFCVSNTSTIVAGLFLLCLCWTERITLKKILFATIAVYGVILVIQPWTQLEVYYHHVIKEKEHSDNTILCGAFNAINSSQVTTDTMGQVFARDISPSVENNNGTRPQSILVSQIIGYTSAVSSGIFLTLEVLIVKRNSYINEHPLEILFCGWTLGTCISLILMFIIETPVLPSNWFDISMVIIHSVTCAAIWPLIMYGSLTIRGNTVTIILSTEVVFMLISQYTVLSSILPGHRNWMEVVGVVIVLLGSSLSSMQEILAETSFSCWRDK